MSISMNQIIFTLNYIDKTDWPDGPWKLEPDKMLWIDEDTGYECLIKRIRNISHLCGYVGITKEHPLYKTSLLQFRRDDTLIKYFDVHGMITMSYPGKLFSEEPGPDHKLGRTFFDNMPNPNEIWWIGMDFVQNEDIIPIISDDVNDNNGERIYRDIGYVTKEVTKLALLLHRFETEYNAGNIKFEKLNHPIPAWAL
jgi:hypothetical protein